MKPGEALAMELMRGRGHVWQSRSIPRDSTDSPKFRTPGRFSDPIYSEENTLPLYFGLVSFGVALQAPLLKDSMNR